ncbi:epimerase [Ornithobacterium rhinotracheale]|uniref:epimerase n=1 Tax=Ornithobacterium rhinotracheale TaxID=28251 RepID=UPI00129C8F31|nr:epimerase [Ornithobacterium rhinotracheale]MRJ08941.1 epimerase [Ornithobacterium rhinotracheale]MRJ10543.1 epimerase [Ornithobacterium rhinotracheale]UOH78840.1 epimerase [Ornithobacterium rhinotracheale]
MKIGIIGCGWLGVRLAEFLQPANQMFATTTHHEKIQTLAQKNIFAKQVKFGDGKIQKWTILSELDAVVVTVPFGKRHKINYLEKVFSDVFSFIEGFQKFLILISSIGIYPKNDEKLIFEDTYDTQSLNPAIVSVEKYMKKQFSQINILRLGGLMGDDRYLSKYNVKDLDQKVNHVHFHDVCRVILALIEQNVNSQVFNVVAPEHPTKRQVINYQKNKNDVSENEPYGRVVSSEKLIQKLNFTFSEPNPCKFY